MAHLDPYHDKMDELTSAVSYAGLTLEKTREGFMHPSKDIEVCVKRLNNRFSVVDDEAGASPREFATATDAVNYFMEVSK